MRTLAVCAAFVASLLHDAVAVRIAEKPARAGARFPLFSGPAKVNLDHRQNMCRHKRTPEMCQNGKEQGYTAGLVISSYKEDLAWLNNMSWDGTISVFIHDRSAARSHNKDQGVMDNFAVAEQSEKEVRDKNSERHYPVTFETIPNKGDEATAYLAYIIQKYFKLPDVVFFVQGHRCAKHAEFDMARALPSVRRCFDRTKGYLDLNTYDGRISDDGPHCMDSAKLVQHPLTGYQIDDLQGIWDELFKEEYGHMPDRMCWDGYAQFAVKKELILRHPLSFYKKLFKGVTHGLTTMEFFWKLTFLPSALSMKDHTEEKFKLMKEFVLANR
mmetsp:Transcript_126004/g.368151  ORF Transcript_126004/g.368151 Transcript_126004/m.368151 type:complete len:328 (+) Transcript_126004:74-1057(+)